MTAMMSCFGAIPPSQICIPFVPTVPSVVIGAYEREPSNTTRESRKKKTNHEQNKRKQYIQQLKMDKVRSKMNGQNKSVCAKATMLQCYVEVGVNVAASLPILLVCCSPAKTVETDRCAWLSISSSPIFVVCVLFVIFFSFADREQKQNRYNFYPLIQTAETIANLIHIRRWFIFVLF